MMQERMMIGPYKINGSLWGIEIFSYFVKDS
jgi:hypothetical protein